MSEDERNRFATDEGQDKDEDVEGHRNHPATDEGKTEDESDDVEAHRQHGGVGRQHGGA